MIAQVQADTLVRALLIAMVVVSPYAVLKVRQVRRRRAAAEAAAAAMTEPVADPAAADPTAGSGPRPRLEDVIDAIGALREADGRDGAAGTHTVLVPRDATVDGDPVPAAVADALVRDALSRSGLVATGEVDTPDGRLLECSPSRRRDRA